MNRMDPLIVTVTNEYVMEIRSNEVASGGQTSFTFNKFAIRMFLLVESGSIDVERWLGLPGCNMDLT